MNTALVFTTYTLDASMITFELFIWSIYVGLLIATFMTYYVRKILGSIVDRITFFRAFSPETAKTFLELNLNKFKSFFVKRSVKKGSLARYITALDADGNRRTDKDIDFGKNRFYIDEEKRVQAQLRFSGKDTDVFGLIIAAVVFFVVAVLLILFLPSVINKIGDMF